MAYYDPAFYRRTLAILISFLILSTISVGLRFYVRSRKRAGWGSDDWWALVALLGYIGYTAAGLVVASNGSGLEPQSVPLWVLRRSLKAIYTAGIIVPFTITAAKLSILMLYRRVFIINKPFRIASNIMLVVCLLWWAGTTLAGIFVCSPIHKYWDVRQPGHCFSIRPYLISGEALNCVIDFALIVLPIGVIQALKLPVIQKINLGIIFALGGFVGVISIIRIKLTEDLYKHGNRGKTSSGHWLAVQLGFAVICTNLPTYRPLLPSSAIFTSKFAYFYSSLTSMVGRGPRKPFESTTHEDQATRDEGGSQRNLFTGWVDQKSQSSAYTMNGKAESHEYHLESEYPLHSIKVTKSVDVV